MNRKEGKIKEFAEIRSFGTETSDETTNLANLEQWNRDEFLNTAKIESAINGKTLNTRKVHPIQLINKKSSSYPPELRQKSNSALVKKKRDQFEEQKTVSFADLDSKVNV